jgi:hypothetical protein
VDEEPSKRGAAGKAEESRLKDVALVVRATGGNQFENGNDSAVFLLSPLTLSDCVVGLGGHPGRWDQVLEGEGLYCDDDDDEEDALSGRASMDKALWLGPMIEDNWPPGGGVVQQLAAYLLGRDKADTGCQALASETRSALCSSISSNSKVADRMVHLRLPRSLV